MQRTDRFSGTAGQRLLLWSSVVRLFEASPPSRLVVGFGPESLALVLPPHLPAELPERTWRPDLYHDRAHNALLDAVAAGGLLRLLAGLGLAFAALRAALRLAGARWSAPPEAAETGERSERWRYVALAAALCGHAVAAQFGVPTAATATLFWLSLALLAGAQGAPVEPEAKAPAGGGKRAAEAARRSAARERRWRGFLAGGLLAMVAFGVWVPAPGVREHRGRAVERRRAARVVSGALGEALLGARQRHRGILEVGESGVRLGEQRHGEIGASRFERRPPLLERDATRDLRQLHPEQAGERGQQNRRRPSLAERRGRRGGR